MLDLKVTVTGDKIIITGLSQLAADMPLVVQRGLSRSAQGIYEEAQEWLRGSGAKGISTERTSRTGKKYLKWGKKETPDPAGGYPVPIRTGFLESALNFLSPGKSKDGFSAGPMEAIVYDSAEYATVIHEGTGSSAKFGKRPFIDDALAQFNQGGQISGVLEQEIQSEIQKRGLA